MNSHVQRIHKVNSLHWVPLLGIAISLGTGCGGSDTVVTSASGGSGGSGTSPTCQSNAQCLNGYTCSAGVCVTTPGNTGGAGTFGATTGGAGTVGAGTGGAGTVGGGGCSGTIGNMCSGDASTIQIAACRYANCCTSLAACASSTTCVALFTCVQPCTTDACVTNCANANPGGVTLFTTYLTCDTTYCGGC